jgi:hypothetical protein
VNCHDLQEKLIERSELDPECQQHLDGCGNCRRFAADLKRMASLLEPPAKTPAHLREQTLERCQDTLANQTAERGMTVFQRCGRILGTPQFVVAAAALGVVILGWWLASQLPDIAEGNDAIMSIKLTFVQIGLQNFVAALLFPIIWLMKSRLLERRRLETG